MNFLLYFFFFFFFVFSLFPLGFFCFFFSLCKNPPSPGCGGADSPPPTAKGSGGCARGGGGGGVGGVCWVVFLVVLGVGPAPRGSNPLYPFFKQPPTWGRRIIFGGRGKGTKGGGRVGVGGNRAGGAAFTRAPRSRTVGASKTILLKNKILRDVETRITAPASRFKQRRDTIMLQLLTQEF